MRKNCRLEGGAKREEGDDDDEEGQGRGG